jgi:flagellin
MSSEIDRIAGTTTWAGANLMEDSNTKFSFQVGTATGTKNQIDVNIASVNTSGLLLNGGAAGQAAVTDVTSARDLTVISDQKFTFTAGSATQTSTVTFNLAGVDYAATTSAGANASEIGAAVIAAVNDGAGSAGSSDGSTLHSFTATNASGAVTLSNAATTEALSVKIANNAFSHAALAADVSSISVEAGGGNSAAVNARTSISFIDNAIKTVNVQRSELGAVSNRLNHTVNNLTNISSNLSAAKGGIEDADFALETTNLAKNQILQQASTAMLAQANASKQNVLSLLQG